MARKYYIYCDESRQTASKYMLIGGLIISEDFIDFLHVDLMKARKIHYLKSEMKWTKVSRNMLSAYVRFISAFFKTTNREDNYNDILFAATTFETSLIDHKRYSAGDKEVGFYKFYYQFLLHKFGDFARDGSFLYTYLDYRQTKYKLDDLKKILNDGWKKKHNTRYSPFKTIEPRDSRKEDILQLVDILLGAVGYEKNGFHKSCGENSAKLHILNHIKMRLRVKSISCDFTRSCFSVWNFKLK